MPLEPQFDRVVTAGSPADAALAVVPRDLPTTAGQGFTTDCPAASPQDATLKQGSTPQVTLKNGAVLDTWIALASWQALADLQHSKPGMFAAALSMARGNPVPPATARELRRGLLLTRAGELRPEIRDVLLAGYQQTPEGGVLTNPVRLDDEADRAAFAECERRSIETMYRLVTGNEPPERGPWRDAQSR